MARLSYLQPFVEGDIPPERAGLALYRLLAHTPRLLPAWYSWAEALRNDVTSSRELRELSILRTAQLADSPYEWAHHRQLAEQTGIPDAKVDDLGRWRESDAYDELERAALELVEEVDVMGVTDDTVSRLLDQVPESEVVELLLTTSFYQAYARVMQALQVELEPEFERYLVGFRTLD